MKQVSMSAPEIDKKIREIYNFQSAETNNNTLKIIKKAVCEIIKNDLTERQKQIVVLYYYNNMKMIEISALLNVNVSTVSRTLARARKNIYDRTKYYF